MSMFSRLAVLVAILLAAVPAGAGVVCSSTNKSCGASSGGTFTGGAITTPILAPAADNCASVPYSFSGDTNTGVCSSAADTVVLRAGGVSQFTQTTTGITSTVPLLMPNGSVSDPALARSAQTNTGLYWLSNALVYGALGEGKWAFDSETLLGSSNSPIAWKSGTGLSGTTDLFLYRDAANTLAQRNGTNAQTFRVYGSYTDGSNYGRGVLTTDTTHFTLTTEAAGAGPYLSLGLASASGYVNVNGALAPFTYATDAATLGSVAAGMMWKELDLTRSIQGSKTKTLTDAAAAAAFVRIAVPQTVGSNYAGGDVVWTAFAADATPHTQSLSGRLTFTAINNAGTEVCVVDPTAAVSAPNANSSGTLACTFSCASNAADTIDLMATCDTSLGTPTALSLLYRLDMPQPNTVTPQ